MENNDKFFIQTTDINLGIAPWNLANGWEPIGNSSGNSFSGTYDGNNYSVDGLYINRNDFLDSFQGLFGYATGALIKNIALTNVNVICGGERTGTLLGQSWNSTIINCSSTGTKQGRMWTGGLVGRIADNSLVDNCFSRVNISGSSNVGGLVGICEDSTISNSYSMGNVSGNSYVGGLVGRSFFANILNTYSTGYVTGTEYVGGLNGVSTNTTIINSYWNIETSGQSTSSGAAEGRSTTEMTYPYAPNTYVDWDFTDIWIADQYYMANEGYPYLRSQISQYPDIAINPIPPTGSENVSVHLEQVAWSYAINPFFITPAGFRVYLNTTDVFEDDDFIWIPYYENQIEYSCSEIITELAYSTTYYWQVIPSTIDPTEQRGKVRSTRDFYKASSDHDKIPRNDAQNCPVWNFTTEQDSSLDDTEIHLSTELTGNFPNPFNPETTIKFTLSQQGEVKLTIYNIKGQLVRTLLDEYRELGEHWIIWNGQDERGRVVPSGVYLYQLLTERETITNRMIMLK